METTFTLAKHFGVTPFEVMAQDVEEVIMVVNYIVDSGNAKNNNNYTENTMNEKDQSDNFWSCL